MVEVSSLDFCNRASAANENDHVKVGISKDCTHLWDEKEHSAKPSAVPPRPAVRVADEGNNMPRILLGGMADVEKPRMKAMIHLQKDVRLSASKVKI